MRRERRPTITVFTCDLESCFTTENAEGHPVKAPVPEGWVTLAPPAQWSYGRRTPALDFCGVEHLMEWVKLQVVSSVGESGLRLIGGGVK